MHTKISLFTGITPDEYKRMMSCFHAIEKSFSADETICFFSDHPDRIGCLLEGEAAIIRTHLDGRQTILEYLKEGETRDLLVKEHEELTKAIKERNVEKAKQLSFQHIENQRMAIMRSIEAENAERERAEREKSRGHR